MDPSIPVVDLQDFRSPDAARRDRFVRALGDALVDTGFFALVNHGVDLDLVDRAYGIADRFFALPEAQKRRYEEPALKGQRGYSSLGREHAKDHPVPDLKEFWHVGRDLPPDHALQSRYPKNLWVAELPEFEPTFRALFGQLDGCAIDLLKACALYLGEPADRISALTTWGDTILRVLHYPPVPEDAHPQAIRAAAHEDINLITLLCESTAPGLELLQRDGKWRKVHALSGQIIGDAGDMLQWLSNGLFKSTTHRVVNPESSRERRYSMPFFVHPRHDARLDPLPSCVAKTGGVAKFGPISAGQYLEQRLAEIGLKA